MIQTRFAIREATKKLGIENVLGVSWWCFGDNMELERGMTQPFGLFSLKEDGLALEPKPGVEASIRVAEAWRRRQIERDEQFLTGYCGDIAYQRQTANRQVG
jgi:hypothetical protein